MIFIISVKKYRTDIVKQFVCSVASINLSTLYISPDNFPHNNDIRARLVTEHDRHDIVSYYKRVLPSNI